MNTFTNYPSLSNQHVLITGGASGIGAALVSAFFQQHCKVTFIDCDLTSAEKLRLELTTNNLCGNKHPIQFYQCDVTQIESLQQSIELSTKQHGAIDILVNNAANDQRYSTAEMTPALWRENQAINLDHLFFAAQSVHPMMQKKGSGVIINFSSINALIGAENLSSYVAAKAGILGLTKSQAKEFGVDNIRVNAILPGWVATEKQLKQWLTAEAEAEWMKQVCLKRRIQPADVAHLAIFLASDDAKMITSQEFVIDGGRI